jgi:FkbM family methyltransferase
VPGILLLRWQRVIRQTLLGLLPTAVAGRLRALYVRRLVARFPARVVEHQYGEGPLKVHLADPLARGWYDHDWPQLPEIVALRGTSLREGARVFDLGAHQGVVAMMLAREVGAAGRVIAVEPNPHNAAVALKNRDSNGMTQIDVLQAAVSDHAGTLVFNEGLDGQIDDGSGAFGRISVSSTTLDDLADRFGMPSVVVIDVEGAECLVLAGGQRVLASGADFVVEVHVDAGLEKLGGSVERVISYFPPSAFTLMVRSENDERFRPFRQDDPITQCRFFLLATADSHV